MNLSQPIASARTATLALAASVFLAACGGGSSGSAPVIETPTATTGTFGLFITDKPSEDFAEINLDITKAVLIGGDDSQQVLFDVADGAKVREIDLLDLTNFNEPIVFGEVAVGTYTKLRLFIDNLQLVPHGPDAVPISIDKLPANGKIDLLDQDGFDVLPGGTLLAEVDIDANKSIKVTSAGKSSKYNFRPVVKVQFSNDGAQEKLARVEGFVSDPLEPTGSFSLCATETADNCVDVITGIETSFFDSEGLFADFTGVTLYSPVVVIGRYEVDPDVFLDAIVVEIGGTAVQVKGQAVSNPLDNKFLLLAEDDSDLTVELQTNTRYFDADGEIGADSIVLGAAVEVEGVLADADTLRAALVFVEAEDDDQLSGTIADEPAEDTRMFMLTPLHDESEEVNNISVHVMPEADILFVDVTESTVAVGEFDDLAMDQSVDIFGVIGEDSIFHANEIIVEGPLPSP